MEGGSGSRPSSRGPSRAGGGKAAEEWWSALARSQSSAAVVGNEEEEGGRRSRRSRSRSRGRFTGAEEEWAKKAAGEGEEQVYTDAIMWRL